MAQGEFARKSRIVRSTKCWGISLEELARDDP